MGPKETNSERADENGVPLNKPVVPFETDGFKSFVLLQLRVFISSHVLYCPDAGLIHHLE
jgi:hypothetical protein